MASEINQQCGGALIAPWEVGALPDEWINLFEGLALDLPEMRKAEQAVRQRFEKFRQDHPTYRKY